MIYQFHYTGLKSLRAREIALLSPNASVFKHNKRKNREWKYPFQL